MALILAGCGVFDGAEIHESVLTLLALDRAGASVQCFAPDIPQLHVVDHLRGEPSEGNRNVLVESARIARGKIKALRDFQAAEFDALVLPGGFGAAKNLCTFAVAGKDSVVDQSVAKAIAQARDQGLPIGAMCIAPAILATLIPGVRITVGAEGDASATLREMGAEYQVCNHAELCVDEVAKVVTTPCYMLDASISQIAAGTEALVTKVLAMAN